MSEISLYLVGEQTRISKIAALVFFASFALVGLGFLLISNGHTFGNVLLAFGVPLTLFALGYMSLSPGRPITLDTINLRADSITVRAEKIDFQSVKVIETRMAFKGGPSYGNARYLSDGTSNQIRVVYRNSTEENFSFYLEFNAQLKLVEQILRDAKQRHGFTLIM